MTDNVRELAQRICHVLDDGGNLLAGSAMHQMLKEALAVQPTYCAEKLKPGGCQLHDLHCGWPSCNKPQAQRTPHETPR